MATSMPNTSSRCNNSSFSNLNKIGLQLQTHSPKVELLEALWDNRSAYSNRCNLKLPKAQTKRHLTSRFSSRFSRFSRYSSSHPPCKVKEVLLPSSRLWARQPKTSQVVNRTYSCSLVSNNLMVASLQACKASWAVRMVNKSLSINNIFSQLYPISGKLPSKLNNQEPSQRMLSSSSSNSQDSKTSASCSTKPSQTAESV